MTGIGQAASGHRFKRTCRNRWQVKHCGQATVCLELDRSLHIGPDYRVAVSRQDLAQAVKLGIDSLFFFGNDVPVLACGSQVQFVGMPPNNIEMNCNLAAAQRICTSPVEPSSGRRRAG